jgi:hypothetical protein
MDERLLKKTIRIALSAFPLSVWLLIAVPIILAQTTGRPSDPGGGPIPRTWSADAAQAPQAGNRHNAWLQGDERQHIQLMGCYKLSSDLDHHARSMSKSLSKSPVDWLVVRNQYADMKKGVLLLIAEHEEFVSGLNNGQSSWWETRLQKIMVLEFKLEARMGAVEGEMKETTPGPEKLRRLLTDIAVQFKEWNDCYAQMGADMDIENLSRKAAGTIRGLPGTQNP